MTSYLLLLGSNLENRLANLQKALSELAQIGLITKSSSVYETSPWGNENQQSFLNQVIEFQSDVLPEFMLSNLLDIEKKAGRIRQEKWGARILDVDILFAGQHTQSSQRLTLPHPELHKRRFTLVPLHEIVPDFVHPVLKLSVTEMLAKCEDQGKVWKYEASLSV